MKKIWTLTLLLLLSNALIAQVTESIKVFTGHTNTVYTVAISPNGKLLASGSGDKTIRLWDINTGNCINTINNNETIREVVFSPDGTLLASGSWDRTISLWNVSTGVLVTKFNGHMGSIESIVFTPDGKELISGATDDVIKLWDIKTSACIKTFTGHTNMIRSVAVSADGQQMVSGSVDKKIRLWDINSAECLLIFSDHTNTVESVAFSSNGRYMVSGSADKTIKLWDLQLQSCIKTFTGHTNGVVSVGFSPDSKKIISGSIDETIKIWDISTGKCLKTFKQNTGALYDVAISSNGMEMASASGDNTAILWDVAGYLNPLVSIESQIKKCVESKINVWQTKGEFEKIADFQSRVNDASRKRKVDELTAFCLDSLKGIEAAKIANKYLALSQYDPDNETYLVDNYWLGVFALPVPSADAQAVKTNWANAQLISPDFYVENGKFKLSKFSINCNGKTYTYDSKVTTTYAANNITYNFAPIDIAIPNHSATTGSVITNANVTVGATDVDTNIPTTTIINDKTFVLIIANENYADEVKVDYAINDGLIFKQYCEKTLGIPVVNIHFVKDATYGKLISEKGWLTNNLKAYKGEAKAIFYYAGHGIPGGEDKPAYLLPVDGNSMDITSALMLDDLYTTLTQHPSNGVTVFIDACFSGSTRDASMLASARGTKLKPRESTLPGNLVVFSAASGDETAWPYKDKQHGMFTYYLLKKLQETKGDVSYKALADYINDSVYKMAIKLNNKPQTPSIKAGTEALGWENRKLK